MTVRNRGGKHRSGNTEELQRLCERAFASYRTRVLDNLDLDRLPDLRSRAAVMARALIERGDAKAFALGRAMLAKIGTVE